MTQEDSHHLDTMLNRSETLYTNEAIHNGLKDMAKAINKDFKDKHPIFLCAVNGAIMAMGSLMENISIHCQMDNVNVSRFHGATSGEDQLTWYAKPRQSLKGRHIIIFDDILDAGITLSCLRDYCFNEGALTVTTAVLIDRIQERDHGLVQKPDYVVFELEKPEFLIGYGLDYKGYFRNLPDIKRVLQTS